MSPSFVVAPANRNELGAAFRLMFQHAAAADRSRYVDKAMQMVDQGDVRPADVFLIRSGGDILAMIMHTLNAGAAGQIWLPGVKQSANRSEMEDALVQVAVESLDQRGAKFIQAMIHPDDASRTQPLLRAGFRHISSLFTLAHSLQRFEALPDLQSGSLRVESFNETDDQLFADVLYRTYAGTLDFPELNGIRTAGEIMDAHRHHGAFHPEHWQLIHRGRQPAGVSLLVELADCNEWELSYIGVVPEARNQGVGRLMVQQAIRTASSLSTTQLTVSVDERNKPALELYKKRGFTLLEENLVFMRFPN